MNTHVAYHSRIEECQNGTILSLITELAYLGLTPGQLNNELYFLSNKPLLIATDPLKSTRCIPLTGGGKLVIYQPKIILSTTFAERWGAIPIPTTLEWGLEGDGAQFYMHKYGQASPRTGGRAHGKTSTWEFYTRV